MVMSDSDTSKESGLSERIRELGLEQNAVEFSLNGYTIVENAASSEFCDRLREAVVEQFEKMHRENPDRDRKGLVLCSKLLDQGRVFEEAVCNPRLVALMEYMLGEGYIVSQVYGSVCSRGSKPLPIHNDYIGFPAPYPPFPQMCAAIWATQDFTVEGGCTRLVPKSSHLRRPPSRGEGENEAVPMECPKGSIVMWDGATWHGNYGVTGETTRVALHTHFNRLTVRPFESYDLPQEVIDRNPPEFASLLGLNDPFGKSTHRGPDYERLAIVQSRIRA